MVLCVVALVVFSVLGVFSAKYRRLAREAFDCVFRNITLRPCTSGLGERIKSRLTAKIMGLSPRTAGIVYRNFRIFSWLFTIAFFVSMIFTAYGTYNLLAYGSCQPGSTACVVTPITGQIIEVLTCNEAKIAYVIIAFALASILLVKRAGRQKRERQ